MDPMTIAIASLAFTVLLQVATAAWWASKVSQQVESLTSGIACMANDMRQLRVDVARHDKHLAVIHATQRPAANGNGAGHG